MLKGSGWHFARITKLELRINHHSILSRALSYIELPKKYKYSKSIVNVQNFDNFCFKYCILSQFIEKDKDLWMSYQNRPDLEAKYDWNCIDFPVALNDIQKFSKQNNISINVFGIEKSSKDYEIFPLSVCDKELDDHRDLLYVSDDNENKHYCCITNFNALISPQLTRHTYDNTFKVCKRCFTYFTGKNSQLNLNNHKEICANFKAIRCELPPESSISFQNHHHSKRVRFAIYADFECMLRPIDGCNGDPAASWTRAYQEHIPYSYSYFIKDSDNEYSHLRLYRGNHVGEHFMYSLVKDIQEIGKILYGSIKPMLPMTDNEINEFNNATICHICKKGNFLDNNRKVKDHCDVTGKYRGAAHNKCNLMYRDQMFVPVILHNMSSYDAHIIVKCLGYDENNIDVIAKSDEKYISFTKYVPLVYDEKKNKKKLKIRFIDSLSFMNASLSKLAESLPEEKFCETKNYFGDNLNLLCKKGIFPYDYVTNLKVLEDNELPPKSAFFNKLSNADILDEQYQHAKDVWQTFNITNLGEYSDIYLKTDVLLLTDVFENFREVCLHVYNLDALYYFTVPGLAYSAMLKYTGVELSLMKDIDMMMTIERGIRGGICQCVLRYAETNDLNSIYYIDANNLYGWAMTQYLPYGDFRWLSDDEIANLDVLNIADEGENGYIVEVDLEYPVELHDEHGDLPFCSENVRPPGSKHTKLLTTLYDKTKYVMHYRNLKQVLHYGMKLKKIHKVIKFNQSNWLKKYIDLNTEKRKMASNEFDKFFLN